MVKKTDQRMLTIERDLIDLYDQDILNGLVNKSQKN